MLRYVAKFQTSLFLGVRSAGDRGATAVEYGLVVGAIGLALLALPVLGAALDSLFGQATTPVVVPLAP